MSAPEMGQFRFRNRNWNRNRPLFKLDGIGIGIELNVNFLVGIEDIILCWNWNRNWNRNWNLSSQWNRNWNRRCRNRPITDHHHPAYVENVKISFHVESPNHFDIFFF